MVAIRLDLCLYFFALAMVPLHSATKGVMGVASSMAIDEILMSRPSLEQMLLCWGALIYINLTTDWQPYAFFVTWMMFAMVDILRAGYALTWSRVAMAVGVCSLVTTYSRAI